MREAGLPAPLLPQVQVHTQGEVARGLCTNTQNRKPLCNACPRILGIVYAWLCGLGVVVNLSLFPNQNICAIIQHGESFAMPSTSFLTISSPHAAATSRGGPRAAARSLPGWVARSLPGWVGWKQGHGRGRRRGWKSTLFPSFCSRAPKQPYFQPTGERTLFLLFGQGALSQLFFPGLPGVFLVPSPFIPFTFQL
jgi:hypothetical protein